MSIDVLIFTNNHRDQINDAVFSVLLQEIPCDIYIFNNGNNLLLKPELKIKVKKIFNKSEIKRPGEIRNYGLSQSFGEYIFFLDGDDVWKKNKLKIQIEILKKYKNDCVFTECLHIDKITMNIGNVNKKYYYENQFKNMIIKNMSITGSMSGLGIRREVLNSLKKRDGYIFNKNIIYGEDFDLYLRLSTISKFRKIFENLVIISVDPNSYSRKFSFEAITCWRFYVKLSNIFKFWRINKFYKNIELVIYVIAEFIFFMLISFQRFLKSLFLNKKIF
jgi:hypothetical protein